MTGGNAVKAAKREKLRGYDNFAFDLYGTLIRMKTDEEGLAFWAKFAEVYAVYGADYTAAGLRAKYKRLTREEEKKLIERTGCKIPEIKLETVFLRLLTEAESTHPVSREPDIDSTVYHLSNAFRYLSRERMKLYPYVPELLSLLREQGKKVYMLSNAQAVFTVPEMEQPGLPPYFDDIFLSSDIGMKKPEATFFERLIAKHSLDRGRTAMVGNDYDADMGIALACGTGGVHINSDKLTAGEKAAKRAALAKKYHADAAVITDTASIKELYELMK